MKEIIFKPNFIFSSILISSIYLIVIIFLMNGGLVRDTILGAYSLQYKINLLLALLQGMWTSMNGAGLLVLILTAILTGVNLTLLWQRISHMKSFDNIHFVVGGNSILGIVGSGCAACGLPVLALLGLSGSVIYLPFRGAELSYLAVVLLSISLFLLIRNSPEQQSCVIPVKRNTV